MTTASNTDEPSVSVLRGGLAHSLLVRAGIAKPGPGHIFLRVALLIGVTWVPLLILSIIEGGAINAELKVPFLHDFFAAARFLVVGPLLILTQRYVEPWLVLIVKQFRESLVPVDERPRLREFIDSAVKWRDFNLVEILMVVVVFGAQFWGATYALSSDLSTWQTHTSAGTHQPTMAGLWDFYVASPLIRFLWFWWMWRYLIWALFLCRVASLSLDLMATHPDRAGGLGFLPSGQVKFSFLSLAFSVQVASFIGEEIVFMGQPLASFKDEVVATVLINLLIFLTPLLAFTPKLKACKRKGIFEYGSFADRYVEAFHEKWINGRASEQANPLGTPDLQSLADLGSSFEKVEKMKTVLFEKEHAAVFVMATLLPFAPLLLAHYPLEDLFKRLLETFL